MARSGGTREKVIQVDTNYLVGLANPDGRYGEFFRALQQGEQTEISAIAWHEFLCGPFDKLDYVRALAILQSRIISVDREAAEYGAALFNKTGRRRGSSADCMIAAVAILHSATFFTFNTQDFLPFVPLGLRLR